MSRSRAFWRGYLAERTGTYEFRTRRYAAVADEMEALGLGHQQIVVDVGSGYCEFDRYLRTVRGFDGVYVPVDGVIDGIDLDAWRPRAHADFFTAIEVMEHLQRPEDMVAGLVANCTRGVVCTTPNPAVVNVYEMDETHTCELPYQWWVNQGFSVKLLQLFDRTNDTILATWRRKRDE